MHDSNVTKCALLSMNLEEKITEHKLSFTEAFTLLSKLEISFARTYL